MTSPDKVCQRRAHWERGSSLQMKYFAGYLEPDYLVLDAGCGSGINSIFLTKQGYRIMGVDISREEIYKARARAEKEGLDIQFYIGDLNNLCYKNEQFDAIYSGYTLQTTNLEQSIGELARILKRGGIAYVVMFEKTEYETPSGNKSEIDHQYVLDAFKKFFEIKKHAVDEYTDIEEDRRGKHRHTRLVIILQKP